MQRNIKKLVTKASAAGSIKENSHSIYKEIKGSKLTIFEMMKPLSLLINTLILPRHLWERIQKEFFPETKKKELIP